MKTRNGFVSNSSSSSFVFLGVEAGNIKLPDDFDIYKTDLRGLSTKHLSSRDFILGKRIGWWEDNYGNDEDSVPIEDLHKLSNEIISELNIIAPDNDKYPVKLYFGTNEM